MHRQPRMTRRRKWLALRIALVVLAVLLVAAGGVAAYAYNLWQTAGQMNTDKMFIADSDPALLMQREGDEATAEPESTPPDISKPTIFHGGKYYVLNEDSINILFLGIDTTDKEQYADLEQTGHQADTLILVKIDPDTREMTFVNIPRNTLTDIKLYDKAGNFVGTERQPICLQHAYGDAGKFSCEITVSAVSNLLFNIPISNYVSMNMDGMVKANDGFGGVKVTLLDNFTWVNPAMKKGEEYTLMGQEAMYYIKGRIERQLEDNTNLARMKRQTQYYKAFFNTAKDVLKADPLYALELYNQMGKSVVTDLSVNEITYLVKLLMNVDLNDDRIMTLPGEANPENDDFITDDAALKEMLLSVFFEEVT